MPLVINATEEQVTVVVHGNYFTWKPAQEKVLRSESVCRFIQSDRRGYGLAVLPDLKTPEEEQGDVEVSDETLAARKAERDGAKKAACAQALTDYINAKRDLIKNNQVSLARDLARADYKYGPEHEMSDGELDAMRLVAKYEHKGKDLAQDRLDEIKKLQKQIATK